MNTEILAELFAEILLSYLLRFFRVQWWIMNIKTEFAEKISPLLAMHDIELGPKL